MSIIQTKDLTKIYDGSQVEVRAVNGIDLQVEEGEFAAIVGPSGSGKTTFLNMLGGFEPANLREGINRQSGYMEPKFQAIDRFSPEQHRIRFPVV